MKRILLLRFPLFSSPRSRHATRPLTKTKYQTTLCIDFPGTAESWLPTSMYQKTLTGSMTNIQKATTMPCRPNQRPTVSGVRLEAINEVKNTITTVNRLMIRSKGIIRELGKVLWISSETIHSISCSWRKVYSAFVSTPKSRESSMNCIHCLTCVGKNRGREKPKQDNEQCKSLLRFVRWSS